VGTLTLQTIPAFFIIWSLRSNIWGTYILFLIFLGGLLIIFVYLSALIPNEIFNPRPIRISLLLISLLVASLPAGKLATRRLINNREILISIFSHNFIKTYFPLMLLYLLAGLFSAIFICEKSKSPLKTNTYESTKTPTLIKNC
jgi:predicted MFS family arabinose efflux permease